MGRLITEPKMAPIVKNLFCTRVSNLSDINISSKAIVKNLFCTRVSSLSDINISSKGVLIDIYAAPGAPEGERGEARPPPNVKGPQKYLKGL